MHKLMKLGARAKAYIDENCPEVCKDFAKRGYTTIAYAGAPPPGTTTPAAQPGPDEDAAPTQKQPAAPTALTAFEDINPPVLGDVELCALRSAFDELSTSCAARLDGPDSSDSSDDEDGSSAAAPAPAPEPMSAQSLFLQSVIANVQATLQEGSAHPEPEPEAETDAFIKASKCRRHVLLREDSALLLVGAILRSQAARDVLAWHLGKRALLVEAAAIETSEGAKHQPFHTDSDYDRKSSRLITVFCALQDVRKTMGPLECIWKDAKWHREQPGVLHSGGAVLMDSTTIHRGSAHKGGPPRRIAYATFKSLKGEPPDGGAYALRPELRGHVVELGERRMLNKPETAIPPAAAAAAAAAPAPAAAGAGGSLLVAAPPPVPLYPLYRSGQRVRK